VKAYRFDPAALDEFKESVTFYEECQPGLGSRFIAAVEQAISQIRSNPLRFPPLEASIRKCRVSRFPFAIIFREGVEKIEIIAVMHLRREPNYWRKRV